MTITHHPRRSPADNDPHAPARDDLPVLRTPIERVANRPANPFAPRFRDERWLGSLFASLELAGFRDERAGRYRASNDVGDAVLFYALSFGPLLRRVNAHAVVSLISASATERNR